jgi:hypothetical protein
MRRQRVMNARWWKGGMRKQRGRLASCIGGRMYIFTSSSNEDELLYKLRNGTLKTWAATVSCCTAAS